MAGVDGDSVGQSSPLGGTSSVLPAHRLRLALVDSDPAVHLTVKGMVEARPALGGRGLPRRAPGATLTPAGLLVGWSGFTEGGYASVRHAVTNRWLTRKRTVGSKGYSWQALDR